MLRPAASGSAWDRSSFSSSWKLSSYLILLWIIGVDWRRSEETLSCLYAAFCNDSVSLSSISALKTSLKDRNNFENEDSDSVARLQQWHLNGYIVKQNIMHNTMQYSDVRTQGQQWWYSDAQRLKCDLSHRLDIYDMTVWCIYIRGVQEKTKVWILLSATNIWCKSPVYSW